MMGCYQLSKKAMSVHRTMLIAVVLIAGITLSPPVWAQSAEEKCSATDAVGRGY